MHAGHAKPPHTCASTFFGVTLWPCGESPPEAGAGAGASFFTLAFEAGFLGMVACVRGGARRAARGFGGGGGAARPALAARPARGGGRRAGWRRVPRATMA